MAPAGGALIGLQFVVMTLVAQRPPRRAAEAGAAFATPNIIHFAVVLLLSAIGVVPWRGVGVVSLVWGAIGVSGIIYTLVVFRRMLLQRAYKPVLENWSCHFVFPLLAYTVLTVSAFLAPSHTRRAIFFIGAPPYCFSSSAFTTHGTPPPITSSSTAAMMVQADERAETGAFSCGWPRGKR